jgi:hypothetical protein
MLLRVWSDQPYRATRDLDLLRRGDASFDAILSDVRSACETPVEPDGVVFDPAAARIEAIREEDEYAGARTILPARCDTARLMLQIDMGVGDSIWPAPTACAYPTLLDFPAPRVLAYPREVVVAEKFEAMVVLGNRNSRIKDFFDLQYLAGHFEFDRATLTEAIRRTFARRRTPIPIDEPVALTRAYWQDPSRPAQRSWKISDESGSAPAYGSRVDPGSERARYLAPESCTAVGIEAVAGAAAVTLSMNFAASSSTEARWRAGTEKAATMSAWPRSG